MLKVNGVNRSVDVDGDTPVLWVLRDVLGMTGTKFGCGMGLCGACTVHVNGVATRSCITTVESVAGKSVSTIESLAGTRVILFVGIGLGPQKAVSLRPVERSPARPPV